MRASFLWEHGRDSGVIAAVFFLYRVFIETGMDS